MPKTIIDDDFKYIDPMWTSKMFGEYGLTKPMFDDVSTWGKTVGIEDPIALNHMRSFYDKPALVFFQDPTGRVVSYYAHEGIEKPTSIPEMKSALYGLYGASNKMAINFHPDHMLNNYRTVLPGHFFEPINNMELRHWLNDMPVSADHVAFTPNKAHAKDFWGKFDIEDLPMIYKEPVSLDINRKYLSTEGAVPFTHESPFTGLSDVSAAVPLGYGRSGVSHLVSEMPFTGFSDVSAATPFGYGKSAIIPRASHLVSGMPFTGFSDVSAATPFGYGRSAIVPGASHLITDMPFTGFSDVSAATPFGFGKSSMIPRAHLVSNMPFTGFSDVSAATPFSYGKSAIIPGVSHLVSDMPFTGFRSAFGGSPAIKSAAYHLVKADIPYFTAAPAASFVDSASSGFPLVKSASSLFTAEPAGHSVAGLTPVHLVSAAPPATHYVATPAHAATPIYASVSPLAKTCVNCLGAEHAFAPAGAFHAGAGVIPLVKTFGDVGMTHFGAADAYKSAFTRLSADPTMTFGANSALVKAAPVTSSLFASPSAGLTGLAGSPFMAWNKY